MARFECGTTRSTLSCASAVAGTEIIRLQNLLSQELSRRFETSAAVCFTDIAAPPPTSRASATPPAASCSSCTSTC
jgi:hypothetical protein